MVNLEGEEGNMWTRKRKEQAKQREKKKQKNKDIHR